MAFQGGMQTGRTLTQRLPRLLTSCANNRHKHPVHHHYTLGDALVNSHERLSVRAMSSTTAPPAHEPHQGAAEPPVWLQKLKANFCRVCGGRLALSKPSDEREWRHVCGSCGYVDYHNPKMVVGCVVEHQGKVLLCRRAIEPCRGLWTVPAGFMELNESTAAGAARETWEEANAAVQVIAPYAHWDIPVIGQAYILFRAQLEPPYTFSSGPESLEVALFAPEAIPWDQIAFSSVAITLRLYCEDLKAGAFRVHHGVIDKRPGSQPNDPGSFQLRDHMAMEMVQPPAATTAAATAAAATATAAASSAAGAAAAAQTVPAE